MAVRQPDGTTFRESWWAVGPQAVPGWQPPSWRLQRLFGVGLSLSLAAGITITYLRYLVPLFEGNGFDISKWWQGCAQPIVALLAFNFVTLWFVPPRLQGVLAVGELESSFFVLLIGGGTGHLVAPFFAIGLFVGAACQLWMAQIACASAKQIAAGPLIWRFAVGVSPKMNRTASNQRAQRAKEWRDLLGRAQYRHREERSSADSETEWQNRLTEAERLRRMKAEQEYAAGEARRNQQESGSGYRDSSQPPSKPPTRSLNKIVINAFGVLGLQTESSFADVKRAARRLLKEHHPDLGPHDELEIRTVRTRELIEALAVLNVYFQPKDTHN